MKHLIYQAIAVVWFVGSQVALLRGDNFLFWVCMVAAGLNCIAAFKSFHTEQKD